MHRGCGGEVKPHRSKVYMYEDEQGHTRHEPAQFCTKCGAEITGDPQVDIVIDGEIVDVDGEWR